MTVVLLKNSGTMSKQRKGTGYVQGGFSPEPAGIHPCCLWPGRDSHYSLFTKAILALGNVDRARDERLSGRDVKI